SLTRVAICSGLPWVVRPRNTLMSPVFSATKKSPLGAVRIKRGSLSPAAYCSTLKPGGTRGHAFSGRATTLGPLPAEGVARGDGKSFRVILRDLPGFSKRKSVNGSLGGGMLPDPSPFSPWQRAQRRWYRALADFTSKGWSA